MEGERRSTKPAFALVPLTCIGSLVVLSEHFLKQGSLLIEWTDKEICSPLKGHICGAVQQTSCFLKLAQVKKNFVWWWRWLIIYIFFMPCSIRWTLLAIFIITELLCVEPLKGPWQLIATERRYVYKWLGSGQKWNVLVKLHSKLLSWYSDSQQLYPCWAFKKNKKPQSWIPLYWECLNITCKLPRK